MRGMSSSLSSVISLKLGGAEDWTPWNQSSWTKQSCAGPRPTTIVVTSDYTENPPAVGRPLPSGYLSADPFRGGIALGEGQMGRLVGFVSVVIVLAIGMYVYSHPLQSSSSPPPPNT